VEVLVSIDLIPLVFLDYYHDLLTYLYHRKERLAYVKEELASQGLSLADQQAQLKLHYAKESAYLRRRRCRTNATQFSILTQIGQGGYGQVYLARKKDTGEICALKRMSKKLLHKMNEIQHVVTERDVLTQTKTPWLVKLFYAFQDISFVYLAMVSRSKDLEC
jgi:serine/threonine protein kinase